MGNCKSGASPHPILGLDLEAAVKHDARMVQAAKAKKGRRALPEGIPVVVNDLVQFIWEAGAAAEAAVDLMAVDKSRLNFTVAGKCLERIEALGPLLAAPSAIAQVLRQEQASVYDAAYILRKFLLDSPEGVVPRAVQRGFIASLQVPEAEQPEAVKAAVAALLPPYGPTLRFLLRFYHQLTVWQPGLEPLQLALTLAPLTFKPQEGISVEAQADALACCIRWTPQLYGQPRPALPPAGPPATPTPATPRSPGDLPAPAGQAPDRSSAAPSQAPVDHTTAAASSITALPSTDTATAAVPERTTTVTSHPDLGASAASSSSSLGAPQRLPSATAVEDPPLAGPSLDASSPAIGTGLVDLPAVAEPAPVELAHPHRPHRQPSLHLPAATEVVPVTVPAPLPPSTSPTPHQPADSSASPQPAATVPEPPCPAPPPIPDRPDALQAELQRQHQTQLAAAQAAFAEERAQLVRWLEEAQRSQQALQDALFQQQARPLPPPEPVQGMDADAALRLATVTQQVDLLEDRLRRLLEDTPAASTANDSEERMQQLLDRQQEAFRVLLQSVGVGSSPIDAPASSVFQREAETLRTPLPHSRRRPARASPLRRSPSRAVPLASRAPAAGERDSDGEYGPSSSDSLECSDASEEPSRAERRGPPPISPPPAAWQRHSRPPGAEKSAAALQELHGRLHDEVAYCEAVAERLQELEENAIGEFARVHTEIESLKAKTAARETREDDSPWSGDDSAASSERPYCEHSHRSPSRPARRPAAEGPDLGPALAELRRAMAEDADRLRHTVAAECAAQTEAAVERAQWALRTDMQALRKESEMAAQTERLRVEAEMARLHTEVAGVRDCLDPLRRDLGHLTQAVCGGLDQLPALRAGLVATDERVEAFGQRTALLANQLVLVTDRIEPRLAEIADLRFEVECMRKRLDCVPLATLGKAAPPAPAAVLPERLGPSRSAAKFDALFSALPVRDLPEPLKGSPSLPPTSLPPPNPLTDFLARYSGAVTRPALNSMTPASTQRPNRATGVVNGGMANLNNPFASPVSHSLDDEIALLRQKLAAA